MVQFSDPELARYVEKQVRSGAFASAEVLVEAAVRRMMADEVDLTLTPQEMAELDEQDAEIERGNFVDFDTFAGEMRKRFGIK